MNIKSRFKYVRATHYTTTISHYDVAQVDFQVTFNFPAAVPGVTATQLFVDMHQNYLLGDADMVQTYLDDGFTTFFSGAVLPHIIEPPSPASRLVMNFGQHALINNWAPIRFKLINHEGFWKTTTPSSTTPQTYKLKIPMLKNPVKIHYSYYSVLRTVEWRVDVAKNFQLPLVVHEYRIINHAHAQDVSTNMGTNFEVLYYNNVIQRNDFEMKF